MLLFSVLILFLLALVNYRIGGRVLLYPPVVFAGIFAFDLFLVWVVGDFYYPMLPQTLFILVCGAFAFSLGGWVAMLWPSRPVSEAHLLPISSDRMITVLVALVVIGFPLYVRWLYGLVHNSGISTLPFLALARGATSDLIGKSLALTLFGTLAVIAQIVAQIAFYERERHSKRAVVAITVALAMGLLMGQKAGPLGTIVGLLCIDWIKTRRLRWKLVIVMALLFAAFTATIEFYVHISGKSFQEKAVSVVEHFALYASGSIVSFDRWVREPNVAPPVNDFYPYYLRLVRKLGGQVEIPEVPEFVTIGPNGVSDNAYTIYWSFLELGYAGAIACVGVIALLLTLIYKRALQHSSLGVLLYAFFFHAVVFAPFHNEFFSWYLLFLFLMVWWMVYSLPGQWARLQTAIRRTVQAGLVEHG